MGVKIDLTGQIFGRLAVIEDTGLKRNRNVVWKCLCECGNEKLAIGSALKAGTVRSCGCLQKELLSERVKVHGMWRSSEYTVWKGMNGRCKNENDKFWSHYGGRGIVVCDRWDVDKGGSFLSFLEDMGERPSNSHSIDRIDVNGNYTPENCRWAVVCEQNFNQRQRSDNTSGRVGVSWSKSVGKWRAKISKNKNVNILGYFKVFDDAVRAREEAELELYGYTKGGH